MKFFIKYEKVFWKMFVFLKYYNYYYDNYINVKIVFRMCKMIFELLILFFFIKVNKVG